MKRKLLRFIYASLFTVTGMSVNAQTSGSCGDNATWSYEGTTLTISGTGAMDDYTIEEYQTTAPWKAYAETMTKVVIGGGITSVGSNAFFGFDALNKVTFPSSGFTSIGDYAFSSCTKLKNPYLPNTLTNLGDGAFSSSGVKGINIPSGVTIIGEYAFEQCTALTGVSIYDGVEVIGEGAFDGCALTSVAIPNTVTTIGACAFMSNEALKSVFIGSGVANIGMCAFQGCTALKEVGLATATLPTLGDAAFDAGDGETPLDIDAFYVPSADLYSSGWAGYAAAKFKTTYESTWNYYDNNTYTDDPTQGTGAWTFDVPTGTLTVTGTGMLNVSPWMGLTAINPEIYTEEYSGYWYKVKSFVVGEGITGIQTMGVGMQINCASVSLPSTLKYVGSSCLEECAYTSIELPEGLETIDDYTFFGSKLTSLTIPSSVTYIGNSAFLDNQDLAIVTCLGTTPPTFGAYEPAFGDGSYLTAIYVPSESVDDYKAAAGWSTYASKIKGGLVALADNADNSAAISSINGQTKTIVLSGRTLKGGRWNTLCLPFDLTAGQIAAGPLAGATIRGLAAYENDGSTVTVTFENVTAMVAGTPYIVYPQADIVNPVFKDVTISNSLLSVTKGDASFIGTISPVTLYDGAKTNLFLSNNMLYYPSGADVTVGPFRAYFTLSSPVPALAKVMIDFGDDDIEVTGIMVVDSGQLTVDSWYTMSGVRLQDKPTEKGIYIVNGKKVAIK